MEWNVGSEKMSEVPEAITLKSRETTQNLLPNKSRKLYDTEYEVFKEWQRQNNVKIVNEDVILAYLSDRVSHLQYYMYFERLVYFL